jgi:hypothetical protein
MMFGLPYKVYCVKCGVLTATASSDNWKVDCWDLSGLKQGWASACAARVLLRAFQQYLNQNG